MKNNVSHVLFAGILALVVIPSVVFAQRFDLGLDANSSLNSNNNGSDENSSTNTSTDASLRVNANLDAQALRIKQRTEQEINRREMILNNLATRIDNLTNLSVEQRAELRTRLTSEKEGLRMFRTQVSSDAITSARVRTEAKKVSDAHRGFALIVPKAHLMSALDRMQTVIRTMTDIGAKLKVEIDTVGGDVASTAELRSSLESYNKNITDAQVKYQSAVRILADVKDDETTLFQENKKLIADARTEAHASFQFLKDARKDLKDIRDGLQRIKASAGADVSTDASVDTE